MVLVLFARLTYQKVYVVPPEALNVNCVPGQIEAEEAVSVGVNDNVLIQILADPGQPK
jgi:hypothetical protein